MNASLVALAFGAAAAITVAEVQRTRHDRMVRLRARQQVGLVPLVEAERRMRTPKVDPATAALAVAAIAVGLAVAGPIGALAGVIPAYVRRVWRRRRDDRRRDALAEQLAPALQMMIGHLRIGRNVAAALAEVAESSPDPLGEVLREIVAEVRLGSALDEVIERVAARENDRYLSIVASAIALHSRFGGSLVDILDTVVEMVEEEDRLRREIKSLTADGRLSAQVLMAMPVGMLVLISLLSPGYATPLVEHPLGRMMSMGALGLGFVGWRWLQALGRPKVVA